MKLTFWGTRGSIPSPGPSTVKYGGNTACLQLKGKDNECIILDAGTGIRGLGLFLAENHQPLPLIHLLISHTHWDHIQGFPFFVPCYIPGTKIAVKGPVHFQEEKTLQSIFDVQMQYEFFPVSNEQLKADIYYATLGETTFEIGGIQVKTRFSNHPIRSLAYRFEENGKSMVYTGDHEPYYNLFETDSDASPEDDDLFFGTAESTVDSANDRFVEFIRGTDLLVVDGQYTPEEYPAHRRGFGHSSWNYCLDWMKAAHAEKMVLTHHDPARTDEALDRIFDDIRRAAGERGLNPEKIMLAREGQEIAV